MNTIPRKLGRYVVIREIGRGAMGVVYKAHDPIIEREVAIKAIQLSIQVTEEERSVFLARFYREAKAAGKLSHSNIVTIFDVDQDKETGTPFIVMEFMEGTTVAEIISSGVLLPLDDINHMITQLADALSYAHHEGIVHRDIKSSNILVLPGMKVKIMDFGIARLPSSDLTTSGQFVGTPNYMSPEQLEGTGQVDGRSDLFSLGVVFYMLLTGERPFGGESFNTVAYKIVHVDPPSPRQFNQAIPEAYGPVLRRLLAKNPADRYQTGAELIAELKRLDATTPELVEEVEDVQEVERKILPEFPPPVVPSPPLIDEEEKTIPEPVPSIPPLPHAASRHRAFLIPSLILVTMIVAFLVSYWLISIKYKTLEMPIAVTNQQLEAMSKQNTIRRKWELAQDYQSNRRYEQTIQVLNSILKLDPENEEALSLLSLVKEQQAEEEKQKEDEKIRQQLELQQRAAQGRASEKKVAVAPSSEPLLATPEILQPAPEPKYAPVQVLFEHSFPSGSLYVYSDKKLVFTGNLTGAQKTGFLMFKKYKGKFSGSLQLPVGSSEIIVRVICKDLGVVVTKSQRMTVTESGHHILRIRYLENPKQLELNTEHL